MNSFFIRSIFILTIYFCQATVSYCQISKLDTANFRKAAERTFKELDDMGARRGETIVKWIYHIGNNKLKRITNLSLKLEQEGMIIGKIKKSEDKEYYSFWFYEEKILTPTEYFNRIKKFYDLAEMCHIRNIIIFGYCNPQYPTDNCPEKP